MAKSTAYIQNTANPTVKFADFPLISTPLIRHRHLPKSLTIASFHAQNAAISEDQARVQRKTATKNEQPRIHGLRLPHLDDEASDIVPTMGWTIRPDKGGAIHTSEVWLFARPSCKRCGVKSEFCQWLRSIADSSAKKG